MSGDNSMGGVQISPNIQKEKAQIDVEGNEVKPFTKEVIKPVEQPYVPTTEEMETTNQVMATNAEKVDQPETKKEPNNLSETIEALVKAKIDAKINEIVEAKVAEALKGLE
jgi:hypothetical protein